MSYWLAVTTPENWPLCLNTKTWGVGDTYKALLKNVQVGEYVLFYVRGMTVSGIVRVTKPYFYSEERIWKDSLYPHRVLFEPDLVSEETVNIRQFFYSFFPGMAPSGYFRKAFRRLPEDQFELFRDFLSEGTIEIIEEDESLLFEVAETATISLEKDLENFLERRLQVLEEGLHLFIDGEREGRQYSTDVSRIDLLAKDRNDTFVVIELKAGEADRKSLAQILPYMGWVREYLAKGREVRGIIVASDFSPDLIAATNVVANLSLCRYSVDFSFEGIVPRIELTK
ncbi:MAG: EVE domain-containing protein [Methanomassiliicoccales archaeon]|nr:MAG: EVE domain-containing protein [Methanomassiliicoccales archaeon]